MTQARSMTKTELKLYLRDPMAVFFTLLFPLMMLFLFGSIFGNESDPDLGGRGSVDVSVPGYIAITIATNAIMGLPINLATYRAGGVLRRFRATPLAPSVVPRRSGGGGLDFRRCGLGAAGDCRKPLVRPPPARRPGNRCGGGPAKRGEHLRPGLHPGQRAPQRPDGPFRGHGGFLPNDVPLRCGAAPPTAVRDDSGCRASPSSDPRGDPGR